MLWKGKIPKNVMDYCCSDLDTDKILLPYLKKATLYHAEQLKKNGWFNQEELKTLKKMISQIKEDKIRGEDGHTYILTNLKKQSPHIYNKVRAWFSRNEQIVLAEAFYSKENLKTIIKLLKALVQAMKIKSTQFKKKSWIAMTHFHVAGSYDAEFWLEAYIQSIEHLLTLGTWIKKDLLKKLPWGTGPGTICLANDAPAYPSLLRSQLHTMMLFYLAEISLIIARFSWDLIFFSTDWAPYIKLPFAFGSSSMPHKRNPDLLELFRAEHMLISSQVGGMLSLHALPLGYHRDTQKGKEVLIKETEQMKKKLGLLIWVVEHIELTDMVEKDKQKFAAEIISFHRLSAKALNGKSVETVYEEYYRKIRRK